MFEMFKVILLDALGIEPVREVPGAPTAYVPTEVEIPHVLGSVVDYTQYGFSRHSLDPFRPLS